MSKLILRNETLFNVFRIVDEETNCQTQGLKVKSLFYHFLRLVEYSAIVEYSMELLVVKITIWEFLPPKRGARPFFSFFVFCRHDIVS